MTGGPGDRDVISSCCSNLDEYRTHYENTKDARIIGDCSPSYFFHSNSTESIIASATNPKGVVLLRNPIDKMYSQYLHLVRNDREHLSFEDALDAETERKSKNYSDMWLYAESGLYADKLSQFINTFGDKNIKVVLFDDFKNNTSRVVESLITFLDLDPMDKPVEYNIFNKGNAVPRFGQFSLDIINNQHVRQAIEKALPSHISNKAKNIAKSLILKKADGVSRKLRQKYSKHFRSNSSNLRLADYRNSLQLWVKSGFFEKIVFCDNSNFTTSKLESLLETDNLENPHSVTLEILSCSDSARTDLHYGYSELGILDYALSNSNLIRESSFFVKCTGRLFYPDVNTILSKVTSNTKFIVDSRSDILFIKNKQITTQLLVFNSNFYRDNVFNTRNEMTLDEYYIEKFLYRKLIKYKNDPQCVFRWSKECVPVGVAAHSGINYRSTKKTILSSIRNAARLLMPNIWI